MGLAQMSSGLHLPKDNQDVSKVQLQQKLSMHTCTWTACIAELVTYAMHAVLIRVCCTCCRQDDVQIVDADTSDAFAAYYAEDSKQADREVIFNPELGLAMEALPAGLTLQELWSVV